MSGAFQVVPCCAMSSRSESVLAQATHSARVTSAKVSKAVMTPPAPRAKPPSGRGSWGARLATTIAELCGSVRVTYPRIEVPGRRLSTLCMNGLSGIVTVMAMGPAFQRVSGMDLEKVAAAAELGLASAELKEPQKVTEAPTATQTEKVKGMCKGRGGCTRPA